ncbi:hemicentin-2-like isoform X2 [Spodoptera litura]|uniref:Hemolin n=1 Tax=Spodoptera litura TaxID=69820 RepID=A0A9J7E8R5_SPOLT|nr:hemicentin-2-like isoform X2 [Spodoptera litura]
MWDEVNQVKEEVNIMFDKVTSSNASQIENFVLVTFNDPDASKRTVTKKREEFKTALANITPHSYRNPDCAESAMEGIGLALRISMPHSYLYVFTDASAKDYARFEEIKSLSQKMGSQIVFLLTGECRNSGRFGPDYEVYHQLADATSGQVFNMMKDDVKDILKYIEETITGIGSKIVDKKFEPGYDKNLTYIVDPHTGDTLIAITGKEPKIGDVTGPGGSRPNTTHIVSGKSEMAVVKVTGAKPGEHVVSVGSMSGTHAVVSVKSTINFKLGFNVLKPKSSEDTVTRPPPKGNVFMGVKLIGTGVKLETVKILGMADEVIEELKLELVDEKTQFYVTPSFNPPSAMFRVTINGYDIDTKTPVTRRTPTPLSRQDMSAVVKVDTKPKVTIDGDTSITLYVDDPLELICKVHAYPEPEIIWEDKDLGTVIPAEKNMVEVPYDYVSVLKIDKGNRNTTYQCKANNRNGNDVQGVEIIARRRFYFDVIDSPKDIRIEYAKEGKLVCKIDAKPPATINWYKDAKPLSSSSRIEISKDQTVVTLKDMQPGMEGKFMCEARNDKERKVFHSHVEIFGIEKPNIDKSFDEIRVTEKTNGELTCRILKGIPKPTVTWSFRGPGKTKNLKETGETLQLKNAQRDQSGLYICTATNVLGTDNHETEVIVEYPPHIKRDVKEMKIVDGDEAKLTCDVNGVPAPTVYWTFNSINVTSTMRTQITADYSLIIKTTVADTGHYTCHADNKIGKDKRDILLEIYQKPVIDKSIDEIHITEKTNGELSCRILKGIPKPTITWVFRGPSKRKYLKETGETLQMKNAQRDQSGLYICTATNILGTDKHGTEVVVEYPPHIKRDVKEMKIVDGDEAKLTCDVNGVPAPTVYWTFNSINVTSTMRTQITDDYSLIIKTIVADTGHYACHADNKIGKDKRDIFLEIYQKPVIDKSIDEIRVTEKTNGELSCRILKGIPKPTITWVFRGPSKRKYLKETGETIKLKNAQRGQSGLYICTATNVLGTDNHETEVIVEYPPHIKRDVKEMKIVDGDEAKLSCDVIGVPAPTVYWTFNSINVTSTMRTQITADYSLKIKTTLYDIGHYVCHAKNKLGKGKKKVFLQVYVPVTIENPKSNIIKTMVGSGTLLNCIANGYPKPDIKWTFHRTLGAPGTDVTSSKHPSLLLQKLQLKQQGFYMCLAENAISGSASITYEVKVYAPPVIHNVYPSKLFEAIDGDMLLRIQCKATGSPTPTITWQKHGLNLAIGSDWFGMEDDGTLLIRNIDRATAGTYMCLAENSFGTASDYYEVVVKNSLVVVPSKTIYVQEGESVNIKCEIPYKITDQLRWFKNGKLRRERDEIYLFSATRSDDGVYTCRVSDLLKTRSIATKLVVGFKPIFSSDAEEIIEFVHKSESPFLDCEAYGEPRPTSATWTHDGVTMNVTDMSYVLGMELGATGIYECEVSNKFGSIRRSFNVTSRDCLLDIKKSFIGKHPVMFSTSGGWSVFRITKHHMIIPHKGYFYMRCPSGFVNPGLSLYSNIIACCERDNIVKIGRKPYNFADLQCNKEVTPNIEHTENKCFGDNTEYVGVGFKSQGYFMEVYRVCFDKVNDVPLFTKHHLSPHHTDISSTSQWFSSSDISAEEFEELYNCRRQLYDISIALRRRLRSDSCCYGRRQLVNPRDLLPGIPATASFEYKNVVPHWNSCSSKNWDDLEELVRELVKRAGRDLIVFTGTSNVNHDKLSVDIKINNGRERQQTIPLYLWKVVQDPATDSAIAIIQVNIPEITREEVMKNHVLCSDICNNIDWLEGPEWNDVDRGYTYCCNMKNFEKAFGYTRPITSMRRVLFDASLTPDTFLPL